MPIASKEARRSAAPVPGNPFIGARPKIDNMAPPKELVGILKRLITEAERRAKAHELGGDHQKFADLRIVIAYSSQKLRNVIDGNVPPGDVEGELRQALNVMVNTLY